MSESNKGITVLIDLLNDGDFNTILHLENPDENACKSFALFLSLIERGNMYNVILDKVKELLEKKDKDVTKILETVFEYKKMIDSNLDIPAILPRDVFKRGG